LGLASKEAGRIMHGLPLGPGGFPRAELAIWTEDVDEAYAIKSTPAPPPLTHTVRRFSMFQNLAKGASG
jgi:hypothetical protein